MGLFDEPISVDRSGVLKKGQSSTSDVAGQNLEFILDKNWRHSPRLLHDFSTDASRQLIDGALAAIEREWGMYHADEYTRGEINFKNGRLQTVETRGTSGFYAKAEYTPPTKDIKKAQIKVTIPLNPSIDGLDRFDSPELLKITESLAASGYKLKFTPYKT